MKKLITKIILLILVVSLKPEMSSATHLAGADISYSYVSNNTFLVRVNFVRDCSGILLNQGTNWNQLCVSSTSMGQSFTITMNLVSTTNIPYNSCVASLFPPICPATGGGPGYENNIMEAIVTLPMAAADWVFGYASTARSSIVTNLNSPNGHGLSVYATLDNLHHPTTHYPVFNTLPYIHFCLGTPYYYPLGAINPNQDSLVFSFITPEEAINLWSGCPYINHSIPYSSSYTTIQPFTSSVPITMADTTGVIYFIPSLQQVAVVCVLVQVYDTTVHPAAYIGSVKRDIDLIFLPGATGIEEESPARLNIYPNPSTGILNLSCKDKIIHKIELMDYKGALLHSWIANDSKTILDLTNFLSGFYLFKVNYGDKVEYRKLNLMQ